MQCCGPVLSLYCLCRIQPRSACASQANEWCARDPHVRGLRCKCLLYQRCVQLGRPQTGRELADCALLECACLLQLGGACLRFGEARCGVAIEGTLRQLRSLQVFTVLHTEQHGVGISLTDGSDVFTPNGIFSEGIRPMPPPAPPVPPPTPGPSDAPTQMPTATPTDSPQFPETHPPSGVPTATPRDPPVSITGARSSAVHVRDAQPTLGRCQVL